MQTMVLRYYLEEDCVENASGFSADYVRIGHRAFQLENGVERLELAVKKGKSRKSTGSTADVDVEECEDIDADAVVQVEKPVKKTKKKVPSVTLEKKRFTKLTKDFIYEDDDDDDLVNDAIPLSKKSSQIFDLSNDLSPSDVPTELLSSKQKGELHTWLSAFRKYWISYWNYLNNDALVQICAKVPVTKQSLAAIPTFGESKVNNIGSLVLATIYAFLERYDLLHLFPNAVCPTIDPSPIWQDPLSEEAETLRTAPKPVITSSVLPTDYSRPSNDETQLNTQSHSPQKFTQIPRVSVVERQQVPQSGVKSCTNNAVSPQFPNTSGFQSHTRLPISMPLKSKPLEIPPTSLNSASSSVVSNPSSIYQKQNISYIPSHNTTTTVTHQPVPPKRSNPYQSATDGNIAKKIENDSTRTDPMDYLFD